MITVDTPRYFAEIDGKGVVLRVIVASPEFCKELGGTWVETSMDGSIGKNYAGIGHTFDMGRGAFIQPKPFDKWLLDEEKCQWKPPVEVPQDGKKYDWDDGKVMWVSAEETVK